MLCHATIEAERGRVSFKILRKENVPTIVAGGIVWITFRAS